MNDLIDRQAAIDAILEMNTENRVSWLDCALDTLDALPSAEPRWIPVTERLPDDETDILVTYANGEETRIAPVNYGRDKWFDCLFDRELNPHMITAWMPLPEPYERSEDAEID